MQTSSSAFVSNLVFTLLVFSLNSCSDFSIEKNSSISDKNITHNDSQQQVDHYEFIGVNHLGDSVNFQTIQSKYILVEFWASWCPPCRQANPGYVKVYDKFKQHGLEILSISLDHERSKWVAAIEKDNLYWKYHLTDLKGWDSKWAVQHDIEEIPSNMLFDKDKKLIASDLSPDQLQNILVGGLSK